MHRRCVDERSSNVQQERRRVAAVCEEPLRRDETREDPGVVVQRGTSVSRHTMVDAHSHRSQPVRVCTREHGWLGARRPRKSEPPSCVHTPAADQQHRQRYSCTVPGRHALQIMHVRRAPQYSGSSCACGASSYSCYSGVTERVSTLRWNTLLGCDYKFYTVCPLGVGHSIRRCRTLAVAPR